jgi:hypothetical protein
MGERGIDERALAPGPLAFGLGIEGFGFGLEGKTVALWAWRGPDRACRGRR